jgi:hypothetical protein
MSNPGTGVTGPRHCYGSVAALGAIEEAGSGDWTSTMTSTGIYAVTFTRSFTTAPAISVDLTATQSMVTSNAYGVYLMAGSYSVTGFTVITAKGSTLNAAVGFHFIAAGT